MRFQHRSFALLLALAAVLSCGAPQRPSPACPVVRPARSSLCDDTTERTCSYRDPDGCYQSCLCRPDPPGGPRRWVCDSSCGR